MDDKKIIELFFSRSEQAIFELDKKYGKLCHSISFNILRDRQDAEECVNDSYLGIWNKIPPENPNQLQAYICKIVRNLSLKRYNKNTAAKRNSTYDITLNELESCLASPDTVEAEIKSDELAQMIQDFLDSLSEENLVIFMRRYWFSDSYADISNNVELSEKTISVRLTRMRKQLRKFLMEREVLI